MSASIDLFFESPLSIDEFPAWALEDLGLTFRKIEDQRFPYYACYYLRSSLFLERNTSKEMEGYDLSRMNLRLSLEPARSSASKVLAFTVLSCAVMSSMDGAHNGLLIYDCQTPLARYISETRGLFDEISGAVVKFPEHVTDVFKAWRRVYPELPDQPSGWIRFG